MEGTMEKLLINKNYVMKLLCALLKRFKTMVSMILGEHFHFSDYEFLIRLLTNTFVLHHSTITPSIVHICESGLLSLRTAYTMHLLFYMFYSTALKPSAWSNSYVNNWWGDNYRLKQNAFVFPITLRFLEN